MKVHVFLSFLCFISFNAKDALSESDEGGYTILNKVRFPYSLYYDPFMGLIIAFAIKLVPSEIDADLAWNIEANYVLPKNESEFTFPPVIPEESSERSLFDRTTLYKMVELKLDSFSENYGGKKCFLRIICEMSRYSTKNTDILGDILHILLSPTSSVNKNLPPRYISAETYGKTNKHCKKYIKKCPIDLLSFFSVLGEILDNKLLE